MSEAQGCGRVDAPPCQVINWRILVKPVKPQEQTQGGIVLPDEVVQRNERLSRIAQVVDMGTLAFEAKSKAGLDLSKEHRRPQVGTYVLFGEYAGQMIETADGEEYRVLSDTDVLAITDDPDAFRTYV